MRSEAQTAETYISSLPGDRQQAVAELRRVINTNLPKGFQEGIGYGMICFSVPHSIYPAGYHCDPRMPLPFISIASQKNFVALYHMGLYADQALLKWFQAEFPKHSSLKLDMGKSCIRFKKPEQIPFQLIGELASRLSPADWIHTYEKALKKH